MNKILFSRKLAERRKECGYQTQSALAKAYNEAFPSTRKGRKPENSDNTSGVLGTIKNYENPNYPGSPNLEIVDNLCVLLKCNVDYLLGNIDCTTHTSQSVHDITGLSETAIEAVSHIGELKVTDGYYAPYRQTTVEKKLLNGFLESIHFRNMMHLIVVYGMDRREDYAPNQEEIETGGDLMNLLDHYARDQYLDAAVKIMKEYFQENTCRIIIEHETSIAETVYKKEGD